MRIENDLGITFLCCLCLFLDLTSLQLLVFLQLSQRVEKLRRKCLESERLASEASANQATAQAAQAMAKKEAEKAKQLEEKAMTEVACLKEKGDAMKGTLLVS